MHLISKEQELIIFIIVTIIMWLSCLSMHNVPDHVYATWFAIKQSYTAHTLTKVLHWRQYNIKTDNGKFILMHSFFIVLVIESRALCKPSTLLLSVILSLSCLGLWKNNFLIERKYELLMYYLLLLSVQTFLTINLHYEVRALLCMPEQQYNSYRNSLICKYNNFTLNNWHKLVVNK